jgi:hypothetical protein
LNVERERGESRERGMRREEKKEEMWRVREERGKKE